MFEEKATNLYVLKHFLYSIIKIFLPKFYGKICDHFFKFVKTVFPNASFLEETKYFIDFFSKF